MRILLIEDYIPLQRSLTKGLREAGFAVDCSGDGKEGLWYAQSNQYDVIILDLMLPGIDGITILKKLRQSGNNIHILILTAKDTLEEKVNGLELGADDYMVKPFEFIELLARLRALIRRSYIQKQPTIDIDDLHIDLNTQTVKRKNKLVDLTPREFALLEYLAIRAGQVVSRTDIWEHLYEFHSDASSNVVDVYIGYLRKKLETDNLPALIHTIRGKGYQIGKRS